MSYDKRAGTQCFVPVVPSGKVHMQRGSSEGKPDGLSRVHAGKQGDNYYGSFSPGKADHHQPTVEAKSLTIYAEVQKSGVSSILSFWRVFPMDS